MCAQSTVEGITMGRGDKRTAKGKRKAGSHGNSRPRNAELRKRAVNELAERYQSFLDIDAFIAAIRSVPLADDPRAATSR